MSDADIERVRAVREVIGADRDRRRKVEQVVETGTRANAPSRPPGDESRTSALLRERGASGRSAAGAYALQPAPGVLSMDPC